MENIITNQQRSKQVAAMGRAVEALETDDVELSIVIVGYSGQGIKIVSTAGRYDELPPLLRYAADQIEMKADIGTELN